MADLIERQALIDAHYEYCNKHPEAEFHVWSLELMQNTPSAQPEKRTDERTETHGVCLDAISRQAAIDCVTTGAKPTTIRGRIAELPSAQPEPQWIPCSECMYWRDERVLMNDGRARQYNGDEPDELGIKHMVSCEVGINEGAMCLYEKDRGWRTDHTTFRNANDFCSRAKKRPCSYEEWYGIVDGMYAEPWRGEEHETTL